MPDALTPTTPKFETDYAPLDGEYLICLALAAVSLICSCLSLLVLATF